VAHQYSIPNCQSRSRELTMYITAIWDPQRNPRVKF
jgi:hypothetical protein